jgi:hypothetical protein
MRGGDRDEIMGEDTCRMIQAWVSKAARGRTQSGQDSKNRDENGFYV